MGVPTDRGVSEAGGTPTERLANYLTQDNAWVTTNLSNQEIP